MKVKVINNLYDKISTKIRLFKIYRTALNDKRLFVSRKVSPKALNRYEPIIREQKTFIQDPENLIGTPAICLNQMEEYKPPLFYNYDQHIIEHLKHVIKVYKGSPQVETKTYRDVIYMPQYRCFYGADGNRIDVSCIPEYPIAPKKINIPDNLPTLKHPTVYGGHLHRHYGHFLTECIGRLWYLGKEPDSFVIYSETPRLSLEEDFVDIFFRSLNFDKSRFINISQPIICNEIVIPHSSFILNRQAFSVHKVLLESVTRRILKDPPCNIDQPLYLSRTKLGVKNALKAIDNEEILEEKLRERNFAIHHPECLSLQEQITLINKHKLIVGVQGSALHGLLFHLSPNPQSVCLTDEDRIGNNFLLVDGIKNITSVYIGAAKSDGQTHGFKYNKLIINVDKAISALKDLGIY